MAPKKTAKNHHKPHIKLVTPMLNSDKKDIPPETAASESLTSNDDEKSIISFLRANTDSLAAIGLIGTMISLMPSFVEKLNDDVWLGTFSSFQISCLFLSIIAGLIFIFVIFLSMVDKYFNGKYELPFAIFFLILILFLGSFLLFIYSAIQKYTYVQYYLLVLYVALALLMSLNLKNETRRSKIFSLCLILFLFLLIAINVVIIVMSGSIVTTPDSSNTKIQSDVNYYTPLIPQTYGIGFSPVTDKKIAFKDYNVKWDADYGYFFYIDPNIDRIMYLGNVTTNHGELVYWTYDKEKIGVIKPPVNITMLITDQSKKTLVSSVAQIKWSSVDIAQV